MFHRLIGDLWSGLEVAHSHDAVHRDLKLQVGAPPPKWYPSPCPLPCRTPAAWRLTAVTEGELPPFSLRAVCTQNLVLNTKEHPARLKLLDFGSAVDDHAAQFLYPQPIGPSKAELTLDYAPPGGPPSPFSSPCRV